MTEEKEKKGPDKKTLRGACEAILFMHDRPLSLERIRRILGEENSLEAVREAVADLKKEYDKEGRGISLEEVAHGHQLRTRPQYARFIRDLFKSPSLMLSSTALEVLAVIAYKGPVSKGEIERIRGVDSSHLIRGLIDKRLVRVAGRSDGLGRPTLYGTTREFLETFNLKDLSHLPPQHELEAMASESVGETADIKELMAQNKKESFRSDDIEEIDLLEKAIKAVPGGTDFTKALGKLAKKKKEDVGRGESAFDVLEEHIEREMIKKANQAAAQSSLPSSISRDSGRPKAPPSLSQGPWP